MSSSPSPSAGAGADDTDERGDADAEDTDEGLGPTDGPSGREVVVPARLYKTVTVMSTLVAMAAVVGGFVALDAATDRATASISEVNALLALFGLGLIVAGAVTYALGTRFRAVGMESDDSTDPDADAETPDEDLGENEADNPDAR